MANIPVRRRSGMPSWVWWLLGLILLAILVLIILALCSPFGRQEATAPIAAVVQPSPTAPTAAKASPAAAKVSPVAPSPSPGGIVVVSEAELGQPDRLLALVDRPVQVTRVTVLDVVSDKGFWVGPNPSQRLFVVLEEDQTAGQKVEGKADVNPGQTVNLSGDIERVTNVDEIRQRWNLQPPAVEALQGQQVFMLARTVEIVSR